MNAMVMTEWARYQSDGFNTQYLYSAFTYCVNKGPNLNLDRVNRRKGYLILSNVFIASKDATMARVFK